MATIKSYTSLPQAVILSNILPFESADMYYCYGINIDTKEWYYDETPKIIDKSNKIDAGDIPCWSLAALLDVLPSVIKRKDKRMFLTLEKAGAYNLYYKAQDRLDELWETKEELVDACVEMIINLKEELCLHFINNKCN